MAHLPTIDREKIEDRTGLISYIFHLFLEPVLFYFFSLPPTGGSMVEEI